VSIAALAAAAGVSRATFHRVVGSRADLVSELDLEPDPATRDRVLAAAIEMVGEHGLAGLSMDALAAAAGVSRASLYRLFPGKPALFRELVRVYSPLETAVRTLERMAGRPPAEVMPALARAVAGEVEGRVGLIRALVVEITGMTPDVREAADYAVAEGISALVAYVVGEMGAGRLRPMPPVLALQAFIGPILFHLLTRDLAVSRLGLEITVEDAAQELAMAWVRAMTPGAPA
jgi:AcrR family transcriptional regulator